MRYLRYSRSRLGCLYITSLLFILVGGGIGWNWLGVELVAMVGRLVCLFVGGLLVCFVVVCLLTCLFVCLCVPVCVSCLTDAKSLFR